MITTVLLDLDDTILADDLATEAAFMATAMQAHTVAGVDPHELIEHVRMVAAREWREGPFPDWLNGIGTSGIEGLRARFDGDHENWAIMREFGPGFRRRTWEKALTAMGVEDMTLAWYMDPSTSQTILQGMGDQHIDVALRRRRSAECRRPSAPPRRSLPRWRPAASPWQTVRSSLRAAR